MFYNPFLIFLRFLYVEQTDRIKDTFEYPVELREQEDV